MPIIRWLMSHLILALVVAGLVFGYVYRSELSTRAIQISDDNGLGFVADFIRPEAEAIAAAPALAPTAKPEPAPTPVAPPPITTPANGETLPPALRDDWIAARQAFWDNDANTAVTIYRRLIGAYPAEPDPAGELANILLRQGRSEDAAGLYLEAGLRIIQGPTPRRAQMVMMILGRLDPDKAEVLRKRMFDTMSERGAK